VIAADDDILKRTSDEVFGRLGDNSIFSLPWQQQVFAIIYSAQGAIEITRHTKSSQTPIAPSVRKNARSASKQQYRFSHFQTRIERLASVALTLPTIARMSHVCWSALEIASSIKARLRSDCLLGTLDSNSRSRETPNHALI
jgi:hypothetical protein